MWKSFRGMMSGGHLRPLAATRVAASGCHCQNQITRLLRAQCIYLILRQGREIARFCSFSLRNELSSCHLAYTCGQKFGDLPKDVHPSNCSGCKPETCKDYAKIAMMPWRHGALVGESPYATKKCIRAAPAPTKCLCLSMPTTRQAEHGVRPHPCGT